MDFVTTWLILVKADKQTFAQVSNHVSRLPYNQCFSTINHFFFFFSPSPHHHPQATLHTYVQPGKNSRKGSFLDAFASLLAFSKPSFESVMLLSTTHVHSILRTRTSSFLFFDLPPALLYPKYQLSHSIGQTTNV